MSKVEIDRETFLASLCTSIATFDSLTNKFEEIYKTDIERFYLKTLHSKGNTDPVINGCGILHSFKEKRIYGIILSAEDDEILRAKVESIMYDYDKDLKSLVENPTMDKYHHLFKKYYHDYDNMCVTTYFFIYLAINKHGMDADIGDYQSLLKAFEKDNNIQKESVADPIQKHIDKISNPFDYISIDEKMWKICKEIKDGRDLLEVRSFVDLQVQTEAEQIEGGEICRKINQYLKNRQIDTEDIFGMAFVIFNLANISQYFGFIPSSFLRDISLSKNEQMLILKFIAIYLSDSPYKEKAKSNKLEISLLEYFTVAAFYILVKSISQTKQYFEENNNETMFSQIRYYREEKERHDEELEKLRKELQEEREKNDILWQQLQSQGTTTDTKPFMEEISSLNRKVKELQEELDTEREKTDELNTLREFVFSIKSEYVPESDETDLKELIKDKKIIIVGGHIEWRNKLKRKYPSIITMDGHNATSDFTPLSSADLVLLNTSNMSHRVYYKVIETLRRGTTKFDYIGRSINQELYEKEIADIIKKYA